MKPYTLAGFEPGNFCSWGGRDDHYAKTPSFVETADIESVSIEQKLIKSQNKYTL
jgi:hypothetical protein